MRHKIHHKDLYGQQHHGHTHKHAEEHGHYLADVAGQQITDKFADVLIDNPPFLHRGNKR